MANTTNFGWETPDDTDLVKDGAAAMRTLGNSIDASFVDLKGGTTGQVLAKASNTDLDFTWSAADPLSILDAKGDLISATAADTPARLAVGTDGQVLTADSSTATGLKWATAGGWSPNLTLLNTGGTALTGAATITINVTSYDYYVIAIQNGSAGANSQLRLRFNSDSGSNYNYVTDTANSFGNTHFILAAQGTLGADFFHGVLNVIGGKNTGIKSVNFAGNGEGTNSFGNTATAYYTGSSAITSINIISSSGNFDGGTVYVYGG